MKKKPILTLLMALVCLLPLLPSAQAAEGEDWLIPVTVETPPAFTDTAGTIAEDGAHICFRTGLMTGVDGRHFFPAAGLSNAQIIVISARLHRLLSTGSLGDFDSYRLPRDEWWHPYDTYLEEQLPALTETQSYANTCDNPDGVCYRYNFFKMLAAVLRDTGTELPERNETGTVPDCQDPDIIRFYQAGILGGKDAYGTLDGWGPLSRGAAAAMLGRLIDPSLRLTLDLETLDLCGELLNLPPDAPLMKIDGRTVTAEQFVEPYASLINYYDHNHMASMMQEFYGGGWEGDEAVELIVQMVQAESLAEELGITVPEREITFRDGYKGLTAAGQTWYDQHSRLLAAVREVIKEEDFPQPPEVRYTKNWDASVFQSLDYKLYWLPGWSNGCMP